MFTEKIAAKPDISQNSKIKNEMPDESKMRLKYFFTRVNTRNKSEVLKHLTNYIGKCYPQTNIFDLKDSVKIIFRETDKFTIIQLFFEKSKIVLRHNLKSSDHMIMAEPNFEFIDAILKEIKVLGYHQYHTEHDDIQSTSRIELIKRN